MSSTEFKEVMSNSTAAGPASEEMVQAAENQLSLRFPPEYRRFLKEYGAVMVNGFDIAGIFVADDSGTPFWQNVVTATEMFRKGVKGTLPDTVVPVSSDGCDVEYYIDAANQDESGCEVIANGPDVDGETVARSLEEFVVKIARHDLMV